MSVLCFWGAACSDKALARGTVVVVPRDASACESLAAHEVRRYIYLRTGKFLPIVTEIDHRLKKEEAIVIAGSSRQKLMGSMAGVEINASLESLRPQSYWLKSDCNADKVPKRLFLVGGDDGGVLYAAYRFAELLGIRFYLHGDVIPDEPIAWKLPKLDERGTPLFALRGIQPFHDFPEGPDWWNRDDYLAILGQLPKLRMNFFGLHTYPEARPHAEPTVWIGLPDDVDKNGKVRFSYPSTYQNTLRGYWGYTPRKTSEYVFGTAALFERDDFAPDVMRGFTPAPAPGSASDELFERTSAMLRDAFQFAREVGIKTCVGTETPLVIPKLVQDRLKAKGKNPADLTTIREIYQGIFQRVKEAYPIDYYWFWTPEEWTWSGVKEEQITVTTNDLAAALAAHDAVQAPFKLATCGWVLGPPQDRAMFDKVLPQDVAVSCINRQVGYTPVDPGFAEVHKRGKWAIPWMEDDPALSSPQLWVGRMRRDAADALRYGCDGLMGIHWRTRVLGPNVGALARAAWDQNPWVTTYKPEPWPPRTEMQSGPIGGHLAAFPNNAITGTEEPTLYQTVRFDVAGYRLAASNGLCQVTLKFCEPHYDAAGKRVFDVKVQDRTVLTNLDVFARVGKNQALDYTFPDVEVTNGWVKIDFVARVEFPCIAAIVVQGPNFADKVNCGGPAYRDYSADLSETPEPKQVFANTEDFYADWAAHEFGTSVAAEAATIFERIDCKLPICSFWIDGPGGVKPDTRPWIQVKESYSFVDEFGALRPRVKGGGSLERFDYWLNTFEYFRAIARISCAWGQFNEVMSKVKEEKNPAAQRALARRAALPAREELVRLVGVVYGYLLGTVSTTGELGTVANWNQHNLPGLLEKPGEELSKILGEPLPPNARPSLSYRGPPRLIVPTKRTSLQAGEPFRLKVIVLAPEAPRRASVSWRKLGSRKFAEAPLRQVARSVYEVSFDPGTEDFEYYVKAECGHGKPLYYPPTAPRLNQSVVMRHGGN